MNSISDPFKFKLPSGWEDQTAYTFKGPDDGDVTHSLVLTVDRQLQHDTVSAYAQEKARPILEGLQGIEVLKDEETTVPGCHPSHDFYYKWSLADGMTVFQKNVFVIAGGMGFCFSGQFTKRTLKTVGAMVKKVVEAVLPGTYEPQD